MGAVNERPLCAAGRMLEHGGGIKGACSISDSALRMGAS